MITISQKEGEWDLIQKEFPFIEIIPQTIYFGVTGLPSSINYYKWDFGDGNGSSHPRPVHTYNTYGHHKVDLQVKSWGDTWMYVGDRQSDIILGKMDLEADPNRGDKPLSSKFSNLSISPTGTQFTGWQWDYGDTYGATGMIGRSHTYVDYGSFTVDLDSTFKGYEEV